MDCTLPRAGVRGDVAVHATLTGVLATCSLDVLAYVMGDIFDANAYLYDNATWYVSNGHGTSWVCRKAAESAEDTRPHTMCSPSPS